MKNRSKKSITAEEFNELMDLFEKCNMGFTVAENGLYVHILTDKKDYIASLTGEKEYIPPVASISKNFHRITNYHYLEKDITEDYNPYGYRKVYSQAYDNFKVDWDFITDAGYAYIDEYYIDKPVKVWVYDINSAFPYAMLDQMPDTTKEPRRNSEIKHGEIGFDRNGYVCTTPGVRAEIIFPLMDSPFKEYVYEHYILKKNAPKDSLDKIIEKYNLNIPTGCIQRHNIFLRNAIIFYANRYIKKYIDDNTVYCNVDSIYSLKQRNDLPIGEDIGQFKCEHAMSDFKFIQRGVYMLDGECHYSGIPGELLNDIDHPEEAKNALTRMAYRYDRDKRRMVKNG